MDNIAPGLLLFMLTPAVSASLALYILFYFFRQQTEPVYVKLRNIILVYLVIVIINRMLIVLLLCDLKSIRMLHGVFYCSLLLETVTLSHFIYILTRNPNKRKFSILHYIFPLSLLVVITLWSWLLTKEDFVLATNGRYLPDIGGIYHAFFKSGSSMLAFSILIWSKPPVYLLYNLIYGSLVIWHIIQYRKNIADYTAEADKTNTSWLMMLLILIIPSILIPVINYMTHQKVFVFGLWIVFHSIFLMFLIPLICYQTVKGRYIIMGDIPEEMTHEKNTVLDKHTNKISKEEFETYLETQKPYLKPDLKITDIVKELGTNRTYLSEFINQTYQMNFSRFMNKYRLRELEHLMRDYSDKTEEKKMELILKAGFGSYDSYRRSRMHHSREGHSPK